MDSAAVLSDSNSSRTRFARAARSMRETFLAPKIFLRTLCSLTWQAWLSVWALVMFALSLDPVSLRVVAL